MKIWKSLGEKGLKWLMNLFNIIFRVAKIPVNEESIQTSMSIGTRVISKIAITKEYKTTWLHYKVTENGDQEDVNE